MNSTQPTTVLDKLKREFKESSDALSAYRPIWTEHEELFLVKLASKGKVSDGTLSSTQIERSARVMAQLPTGRVQAVTKKDTGKNILMNLVLQRHILPNANAQFDLLTKLRMVNMYSGIYGVMPMLVDIDIRADYIGPDCWLVPIRNFFPQPGRISINDCDWVMISTYMSLQDLEEEAKSKESTWNKAAIRELIKKVKEDNGGKPAAKNDSDRQSVVQAEHNANIQNSNQVEIITKYEAGKEGHWISFAPDYEIEAHKGMLRDIPNPQGNGKIPVKLKHALPLIDSIMGSSDFERGKYLQYAMDTMLNLKLAGDKMRIFPPLKIIANGVTQKTVRYEAAAKWLVNDMNAIAHHNVPNADGSFTSSYQFLKSGLMNVLSSSTTEVSAEAGNPGFSKTDAGIKRLNQRESTKDNLDRFFMEMFVQDLFECFINMMGTTENSVSEFLVFEEEIKQIVDAGHKDVLEIFDSEKAGELKLTYDELYVPKGYRYYIDSSSTMEEDQASQHESLGEIMLTYLKVGTQIDASLQMEGKRIDFSELFKQWLITGGTKDWEKILTDAPAPNQPAPGAVQPGAAGGQESNPNGVAAQLISQISQGAGGQSQQVQPQGGQEGDEVTDPDLMSAIQQIMAGSTA